MADNVIKCKRCKCKPGHWRDFCKECYDIIQNEYCPDATEVYKVVGSEEKQEKVATEIDRKFGDE